MILWGKDGLTGRFCIEWRSHEWRYRYWGRWLGQHRVYWHFGPLIISWVRRD